MEIEKKDELDLLEINLFWNTLHKIYPAAKFTPKERAIIENHLNGFLNSILDGRYRGEGEWEDVFDDYQYEYRTQRKST